MSGVRTPADRPDRTWRDGPPATGLARFFRLRTAAVFVGGSLLLLGVMPLLLSEFRLSLLAKYLCFGLVAIGIGLAWGRGGMLTLGQGVYFAFGGYALAMHLKLADAGPGKLPDFMTLYGTMTTVPWWWQPFSSPWFALFAVVAVPVVVATLLGLAVFKRRVRGAYFAILSQGLVAALVIFLIGQGATTGGTNGLTNFTSIFGYDPSDPANQLSFYVLVAVVVLLMLMLARQLMQSRYGELLVAVRDAEERVRFLGYDPANVKVVAYVVAAGMAGIAGALFVIVVGAISPASIGVVPSIEFVIGVAVGGRATLLGPLLGAVAVAWAKTSLSEDFPGQWTYFQGLLFVVVVGFLPGGLASVVPLLRSRLGRGDGPPGGSRPPRPRRGGRPEPAPTESQEVTA
jgi:urea transport system permease protein